MNSSLIAAGWAATMLGVAVPSPSQDEVLAPTPPPPVEAPGWRAFSRGASSAYLIDPGTVRTDGDVVIIRVARVPLAAAPGDYSHVIDEFSIRCSAAEARLSASSEAWEDGEPTEATPVDEPWAEIRPGSFDEGVQQVGCGEATPIGDVFPTIRAYIDAGRP